jgi:hypothetical protein
MPKPYNKHTIKRDGSGVEVGARGEQAFACWLIKQGVSFVFVGPEKEFHDFDVCGGKIDVKAKERPSGYSDSYEAHVEDRLEEKECDCYVFYSVTDGEVTPCGWMHGEEYWDKATRVTKGEETAPGFIEKANAGKLIYSELHGMDELYSFLQRRS